LSGFEPVEVVKVRRHGRLRGNPPQYYRVKGEFGGVTLDEKASGVEWEEPPTCSVCRKGNIAKRFKSLIVVPGSWSGRDILIPPWSARYLVSERFKTFCDLNDIKNAVFYPAEEYGHDFYPWENSAE
jgi:hypothetical protein